MPNNAYALPDVLVIDIETVPQYVDFLELNAEKQALFAGTNSKTVPEYDNIAQIYRQQAGMQAEFGKIVCLSIGYFVTDGPKGRRFKLKSFAGHDEAALLQQFLEALERIEKHRPGFYLAGHNLREFHVPFICRRLLIHQLPLPGVLQLQDAKPWELRMIDTLHLWRFGEYRHTVSLYLLATVLDIPTKKSLTDGSSINQWYYEDQDLPRIIDCSRNDVLAVANILLRFRYEPLLNAEQIVILQHHPGG
jgi:hypothetical protein